MLLTTISLFCYLFQATKFTSTAKVPKSFIRKNVTLRGRIENVCLDGTLQIDHMPILRMPWHKFMQSKFVFIDCLQINLVCLLF